MAGAGFDKVTRENRRRGMEPGEMTNASLTVLPITCRHMMGMCNSEYDLPKEARVEGYCL
jgi:hypothetical protein